MSSAAKFLGALAADGTITDLEGITLNGLEEKYNPLRAQVEDSLKRQETLINQIKVKKTNKHEKYIPHIVAAYHAQKHFLETREGTYMLSKSNVKYENYFHPGKK